MDIVSDPLTNSSAELRRIQPYAAIKPYRCPGCNQEIAVGVGHVVIVPMVDPTERRHWHSSCWQRRANRPKGR